MNIRRLAIENFRCIWKCELLLKRHNVFLGRNNIGKTAVLEALNLLLNPELSSRPRLVDENDFFNRNYRPATPDSTPPKIRVEGVISDLSTEDEDTFRNNLVPWKDATSGVVERTEEGEDPFTDASTAIRVVFEAAYDEAEDDFTHNWYFLRSPDQEPDTRERFGRDHKRRIGFLIYRDFRALTRPITLELQNLFARLLQSQDVIPRHFEEVLQTIQGCLNQMTGEADFASVLNSYKSELERFLFLAPTRSSSLSFEITDRTRSEMKEIAELYVRDQIELPLQKMGAGTRSLAILAILTLIMRRRQRGILALEEPETFLFPHAQRRVIDECLELADQTFITTHSPYVLERIPIDGVGRVTRNDQGELAWAPVSTGAVKNVNLYTRRLRQNFSEALLGEAVIVTEGESDRLWINAASRILNRKVWKGGLQQALELQAIAVISGDGSGDAPRVGDFFNSAGLDVLLVLDRISDPSLVEKCCKAPCPTIFLRYTGMEDLLASELPVPVVMQVLTTAPHTRVPLHDSGTLGGLSEPQLRATLRDFLIGNKGSAALHEWIQSLLDETTLPRTLGEVASLASGHFAGSRIGSVSLI